MKLTCKFSNLSLAYQTFVDKYCSQNAKCDDAWVNENIYKQMN